VQVAHHALHHHALLRVFLPEVGAVGLNGVEELGHYRCHAAKVTGAMFPFQRLGDLWWLDVS